MIFMNGIRGIKEGDEENDRVLVIRSDCEEICGEDIPEESSPISIKTNYCFPPNHFFSKFVKVPVTSGWENNNKLDLLKPPRAETNLHSLTTEKFEPKFIKKEMRRIKTYYKKLPKGSDESKRRREMRVEAINKISRGIVKMKKIGKSFRMSQKQFFVDEKAPEVPEKTKKKKKISLQKSSARLKISRSKTEYFSRKSKFTGEKYFCKESVRPQEMAFLRYQFQILAAG